MCYQLTTHLTEGSLEVKLPTIWTNGKAEVGRVKEEKSRREKIREEKKSRKKKMQVREKVGMSRITVIFCKTCGSGGSKSRLPLKRPVRSHPASCKMKNCTTLWPEAHLEVKMYKARHAWSTFGSWDVQKVHKAHLEVKMYKAHHVRTTFRSWDVKKSARRCGTKLISKSKCGSRTRVGTLLEVDMSKKCTTLQREAHLEVKMYQAHHSRTAFGSWDVEKVHAVVARSSFLSQNVETTTGSEYFWKLTCRKSERCCGAKHISKSKCTKHTILGPLS